MMYTIHSRIESFQTSSIILCITFRKKYPRYSVEVMSRWWPQRLRNLGSILGRGQWTFLFPKIPYCFLGLHSLVFNVYRSFFPLGAGVGGGGKVAGRVHLTTHLHLLLNLRMGGVLLPVHTYVFEWWYAVSFIPETKCCCCLFPIIMSIECRCCISLL